MSYQIDNLAIGYPSKEVIKNITLTLPTCGLVCLSGNNGSGKSTFLRTITGNLNALGGSYDQKLHDSLYLIQDSALVTNLTGYENVAVLTKSAVDQSVVENKARELGISEILKRKVDQYSYGEKMRLLLLGAYLSSASIVVLDEIDKGVDKDKTVVMHEWLKEMGKSKLVLFSSHYEGTIKTDYILQFKDGQIAFEGQSLDTREPKAVEAKAKVPYIALFKSLFKPLYVTLFSIVSIIMSVLTVVLFTGAYYERVNIVKETAYNYVFTGNNYTEFIDERLQGYDIENLRPNYLSFAFGENGDIPPIYFQNGTDVYFFDATYIDYDVLVSPTFTLGNTSEFTIYPNSVALNNLCEAFNLTRSDLAKMDYSFQWKEETLGYDISKPTRLGETIHDVNLLKRPIVYYSGQAFKTMMEDVTYDTGSGSVPLLDFLRTPESLPLSICYTSYNGLLDDATLRANREEIKEGYYFKLESEDWFSMYTPVYYTYLTSVEGKQVDAILFNILGSVSLALTILTSVFSFLYIRRIALENFLLLNILKYHQIELWPYYLNALLVPLLSLVAAIISNVIFGICIQAIVLPLIMSLLFVVLTVHDSKHACSNLIKLLKTSGQA